MCIIVYKPKRVPMPTLEVMQNCFKANPNGAGFMYRDGGAIHISKGYMELEKLLEAINLVSATVDLKKTEVVIHFRISTHGSSIPANTHPFPLSNNIADLKALNITCDRAIAHNGILHEYGSFTNTETNMSDTMYFAKMLAFVNDKFVAPLLTTHAKNGSRFVFMSGKGKTVTVGLFKPKGTGIWYSNTTYLTPVVTVYNYQQYNYQPSRGLIDNRWMGNVTTRKEDLQLDEAREEAWQDWLKQTGRKIEETKKAGEHVEQDLIEKDTDWKSKRIERKKLDADLADYGWGV